jgi:hypothetical protein
MEAVMAQERESEAGVLSGLLAVVMVVALSAMAFSAIQPSRDPPLHTAQLQLPLPSLPAPPATVPDTGRLPE